MSSIIGEDLRTTRDIDATLKSLPLNENNIKNIFDEILSIDINDNVIFKIENIKDIRLEDEYGGFRINVKGTFDKIRNNFFIEITTGDVITPREINYKYKSIFEDKNINIMAYTTETIIAEKFESIISKNITTTRGKDFYDLYMLINKEKINKNDLFIAIKRTCDKRNTRFDIEYFREIIISIKESSILKNMYLKYQNKLEYTKEVSYTDCIKAMNSILTILEENLVSI